MITAMFASAGGRVSSAPPQNVFLNSVPFFGLATPRDDLNDTTPGLVAEVAAYVALGIKKVRFDFRQSQLGGGSFTTQDTIVSTLRGAGIRIMGILNPNTTLSTGAERTGYASYCGTVAARYALDVAEWEICNEPNIASTAILMANYVLALPLACVAIRAVSTAEIVAGGLASTETNTGGFQNTIDFATAIRDNCAGFYDSLSIHLYTDSATIGYNSNPGASWHAKTLLAGVAALGFTRIHVTETGMPTIGAGLTEVNQFNWLEDTYSDLSCRTEIASYYLYTYGNRAAEATGQDGYGIVKANASPKLAHHRVKEIVTLENDTTPTFEHEKGGGNTLHGLFRRFFASVGGYGALTVSPLSLPTGVTVSSAGVLTFNDATVTPQLNTACAVRAAHSNGSIADFNFTITVYHPNLITTNPTFAGNVTGWILANTATVNYDAERGAAVVDVTGTGGGMQDNQTIPCTLALHEYRAKVRAGTFVGSLNLSYAASDVQIGPLTDEWVWYSRLVTTTTTDAALNIRRFTAALGTFYVDKVIFRLAL